MPCSLFLFHWYFSTIWVATNYIFVLHVQLESDGVSVMPKIFCKYFERMLNSFWLKQTLLGRFINFETQYHLPTTRGNLATLFSLNANVLRPEWRNNKEIALCGDIGSRQVAARTDRSWKSNHQPSFLSRDILVQSAMTVTLVSTWQAWKLQLLRVSSCGVVSVSWNAVRGSACYDYY